VKRLAALLAFFAAIFIATGTFAHEVRPAYLEIEQTAPTKYQVTWKQPTMGDVAIHLVPHISNGWLKEQPADQYAAGGFLIRSWKVTAKSSAALEGQTVFIEGLKDTITDTFVRIKLSGGRQFDTILRPDNPSFRISFADGQSMGLPSFLLLGIQHILTGPDHLLFLLGLLLIVRDRWMLLKTVSSFTLAHSLTLALATFGLIQLSTPLLNALIALSILFVAPEVVRAQRGGTSLTIRHPWVVAFLFGLLHGMGFASGLTSLGLERGALLAALVLFNIGVEIGQLAFIALVFALKRSFRVMEWRWPAAVAAAPTYAIGILGASWTIQYCAVLFGVI
jgi:hydrogenase/urease accessory protein HupE